MHAEHGIEFFPAIPVASEERSGISSTKGSPDYIRHIDDL